MHWVAEEDGSVVGHLLCHLERRRRSPARQLLLNEIGVRDDRRRTGIGRALLLEMERWMRANEVREVWTLADPEAETFYRASGFGRDEDQPVHGRQSYARRAWRDAYESLSLADQAAPLGAEDIELLATSAGMLGRDDDYLSLLERAHHAYLDAGEPLPRARSRSTARLAGLLDRTVVRNAVRRAVRRTLDNLGRLLT